MAYFFPEGTLLQYTTTLASAVTVSAATNANPCAITTSSAHGYSTNDEVLYLSSWSDINEAIFKFTTATTTTGTLQELDTSSTSFYPAGSGVGTLQKLSGWTTIPQVVDLSTSGGDARFTPIELLASRNSVQVATGFNPISLNFTLADDPTNATVKSLIQLSRTLTKTAFKVLISGSAPMYGYGYLTISELPQMARNQVNRLQGSISLTSRATRYGS